MPSSFYADRARGIQKLLLCLAVIALSLTPGAQAQPVAAESDTQVSPRQLYNDGTLKLREGKLREAETCFQSAVASQDERVQPVALYNLGHVRYREGEMELTNAPDSKALEMKTRRVFEVGGSAIRAADEALAGEDTQKIVSAYLQGRGARRELKAAMDAVKNAMKQYGSVLVKWQRSAGDFKSAFELHPSDTEARKNGDVVDRKIAALIDQQQKMLAAMAAMSRQKDALKLKELLDRIPKPESKEESGADKGSEDKPGASDGGQDQPGGGEDGMEGEGGKGDQGQKGAGKKKGTQPGKGKGLQELMQESLSGMQGERSDLATKMKELRKRLPKEMQDADKGKNGDDDEDEDEESKDGKNGEDGKKPPQEPKAGDHETDGHEGTASVLTQDEAIRYLGLLKLDSDRKLPLGVDNTDNVNPKARRGRDW